MRPEYDFTGAKQVNRAERLKKYGLRETVHGDDGQLVVHYHNQPRPKGRGLR
jgi:hypothetical protein